MTQIKSIDKICNNCKYVLWMIAIGQGLRCRHQKNRTDKGKSNPIIPSRFHTCEYFDFKSKNDKSNN